MESSIHSSTQGGSEMDVHLSFIVCLFSEGMKYFILGEGFNPGVGLPSVGVKLQNFFTPVMEKQMILMVSAVYQRPKQYLFHCIIPGTSKHHEYFSLFLVPQDLIPNLYYCNNPSW